VSSVFLTGGHGFLGKGLAKALHQNGDSLITIARGAAQLSIGTHIVADLSRLDALQTLLPYLNPGAVFVHFAAQLPVAPTTDATSAAMNRLLDDTVLEFCSTHSMPLVYASSIFYARSNAYLEENAPLSPATLYHAEKLLTEQKGMEWSQQSGVPFLALRITAPYGPGQTVRTVLRIFLDRALRNLPLQYFGSGTREQDFIFATDIHAAVLAAAAQPSAGIFNIASGVPVTMRDLAATALAAVPGSTSEILPAAQPDPQDGYPARYSIAKAESVLGWRPCITLAEGTHRWASVLSREL